MVYNSLKDSFLFDKRQTNIAKGIAVLMLLWHHLFYNSPEFYDRFTSMRLLSGGVPIECFLSTFCKGCVAVFLLLSGLGLYKSWKAYKLRLSEEKLSLMNQLIFVKNHLLKLMLNYWFIYLIFAIMGVLCGKPFWNVYQGNVLYGIMDFLGISYFFSTPSMNPTWWFMGVIIVFYLLFPLFGKIMDYSAEIWLAICILINFVSFISEIKQLRLWLLPFALGMFLSKYDIFDKVAYRNQGLFKRLILSFVAVLAMLMIRYIYYQNVTIDAFLAFAIILFCYLVLSRILIMNTVLEHLGKHSGAIFMFHHFVFGLYFKDFIYWFKYPPIIFLVLSVICYAIAVGLEYLKHLLRYDKLVLLLTK